MKQKSLQVSRKHKEIEVSFEEWAAKMKSSFERCFWIPEHPGEDKDYSIQPKWVNRRGIYKDCFRSSAGFTDY
jgi:glycogen debranching enzyme